MAAENDLELLLSLLVLLLFVRLLSFLFCFRSWYVVLVSMLLYSVENRSPFLDKNLVEYLYQIPSKFLIKNGYTKWFLREIGNGLVPDQVRLDKRKTGFNASIYSLIDLHNSDNKKWLLSNVEQKSYGLKKDVATKV